MLRPSLHVIFATMHCPFRVSNPVQATRMERPLIQQHKTKSSQVYASPRKSHLGIPRVFANLIRTRVRPRYASKRWISPNEMVMRAVEVPGDRLLQAACRRILPAWGRWPIRWVCRGGSGVGMAEMGSADASRLVG